MSKILIYVVVFSQFISCGSYSQSEIEVEAKNNDLPLKIFYRGAESDSAYAYVCFPKTVVLKNSSLRKKKIELFHLNYYRSSINNRFFRTFNYKDSLTYPGNFVINSHKSDSLSIYYGYRIKELKSKLESFLNNKEHVQKKADWFIYDLPITNELKKWADSKVTDSMRKARIHFSFYNEKNKYDYKSLDVSLFND